jgi:nitrite reductase/ring-hydroxylating ferredoxin subunit
MNRDAGEQPGLPESGSEPNALPMPRWEFLRLVTFGTATSVIAGKLWRREVLAFCDPLPGQKDAVFKVRISDYPALAQDWGSVRLGINPVRPFEPFPDGPFYPFLINRDGTGKFYVLDCECRHAGCIVPTFDIFEMGIRCPCHQSFFGIDGAVLEGPAAFPLHAYQSNFDGNDLLTIRVPCWGFETRLAVLPGGPTSRVKLEFPALEHLTYEVLFSTRPQGPWTVASFATTPTGPANQTSFTTLGGDATLYLDRTTATGFYAVGMKLSEV